MNIRYDKLGIPIIFCHICDRDIEVGDLVHRIESGIHCRICDTHLGFENDLPEKFRAFTIKEIKGGINDKFG